MAVYPELERLQHIEPSRFVSFSFPNHLLHDASNPYGNGDGAWLLRVAVPAPQTAAQLVPDGRHRSYQLHGLRTSPRSSGPAPTVARLPPLLASTYVAARSSARAIPWRPFSRTSPVTQLSLARRESGAQPVATARLCSSLLPVQIPRPNAHISSYWLVTNVFEQNLTVIPLVCRPPRGEVRDDSVQQTDSVLRLLQQELQSPMERVRRGFNQAKNSTDATVRDT